MRFLFLVLVFFVSSVHGQRRPHGAAGEKLPQERTFSSWCSDDSLLNIITDTLPLITSDELDGWRDMRLVSYFYDSSKALKKIDFRDGRNVNYYFCFQGNYLSKGRYLEYTQSIDKEFTYTFEDNNGTIQQLEEKIIQDKTLKERYKVLQFGKIFFERFKELR
jgi:hypothetical protein